MQDLALIAHRLIADWQTPQMLPEVVHHGVEAAAEDQGKKIVAKDSPDTTDMGMGDKNLAWPVE